MACQSVLTHVYLHHDRHCEQGGYQENGLLSEKQGGYQKDAAIEGSVDKVAGL